MTRASMPPGQILDRDIEFSKRKDGIWVRVNLTGHDKRWHGPFDTVAGAEKFVLHTWDIVRTGIKMADNIEGAAPAWIRR